jgi:hypothetical protein
MKGTHRWKTVLRTTLLTALLALAGACNDDPDTDDLDEYFEENPYVSDPRESGSSPVRVKPDTATISTEGGRAVFRVSGGRAPYTWDVADDSTGSMSPVSGDTSTYTAKAVGDNDVIVYDRNGDAAIAAITGTLPTDYYVSASADPDTLDADHEMTLLEAEGGIPPYTWTVSDPGRGDLPHGKEGSRVVYERYAAGDNAAQVTDGRGNTDTVLIKQPMEGAE